MLTELEVMKSMQPHPHVVRLIGCCTEKGPGLIKTMNLHFACCSLNSVKTLLLKKN